MAQDKKHTLDYLECEINKTLARIPKDSIWRHYKGGLYTVNGIGILEASDDLAVRYSPVGYPKVEFIRSLKAWQENVEIEGAKTPRFAQEVT